MLECVKQSTEMLQLINEFNMKLMLIIFSLHILKKLEIRYIVS